jgi:hypothetical protein
LKDFKFKESKLKIRSDGKLILLGAGTSVPFGIPAMKKFVELFKEEIKNRPELAPLFQRIETALINSDLLVGYRVDFDLESVMAVLRDIANFDSPVSFPTFAFTLSLISGTKKPIKEYNIRMVLPSTFKTKINF